MNFKDLKVGDVICKGACQDRTIVAIGEKTFLYKNRSGESFQYLDEIKDWHIKQPELERVKVYCYRNVNTGHVYFSKNPDPNSKYYTRINPEFVQGGE